MFSRPPITILFVQENLFMEQWDAIHWIVFDQVQPLI